MMMIGSGAACQKKFFRALEDSAFAKYGFQHDGTGVGIDGGVQRGDVALLHKRDFVEHRLETFTVLFLAGQGHRAKSPAVIRTLQGDQL